MNPPRVLRSLNGGYPRKKPVRRIPIDPLAASGMRITNFGLAFLIHANAVMALAAMFLHLLEDLARDGMDIVGHTTTTSMPHPIRPSSLTIRSIIARVGQACKVPLSTFKYALGDPEASHRVAFAES